MRTAGSRALIVLVCLAANAAFAQDAGLRMGGRQYSLGPATLVAGSADQAVWSPDSRDLAYVVHRETSDQIGLFDLRRGQGGIVLTLGESEHLDEFVWLNGSRKALVLTRSKVDGRSEDTDLLSIRSCDAETLKTEELWTTEVAASEGAKLEVKRSPLIPHALITLRTTKESTYLVLTQDAKSVVLSSDLSDAAKEGEEMAGWSIYGTAVFGAQSKPPAVLPDPSNDSDRIKFDVTRALEQQYTLYLKNAVLPREGDVVLECVPSNGVLRQVDFPGFFEPPETPRILFRPWLDPVDLKVGETSAHIQSLWMVPLEQSEEPTRGLLVSADAEDSWLSPSGTSIAFTCHHALFLRPLNHR